MEFENFEIAEASLLDIPDLVSIHCAAWKNNNIWRPLVLDAAASDEQDWLVRAWRQRNSLPDRNVYKITDRAAEKIVAFIGLAIPYTLTTEQMSLAKDEKPPPQGHNFSLAVEFFDILEVAKKYGYNPKTDYHKKGAMVYPDYQRKGRGSWLTRHCNEVADRTGDKIFVVARPSSKHMFESHGFHVLGSEDIDMTKYGGNETEGKSWVLVREPHESKLTGAAFALKILIPLDEPKVLSGELKVWGKKFNSGNMMYNHSCGQCDSLLYRSSTRYPGLFTVKAGCIDSEEDSASTFVPDIGIFTRSRVSWVPAIEGAV